MRLSSAGARGAQPVGYRNGFGKPRRLSLSLGTITIRRPRVRGLAERFESRILPLFKRRTEAVSTLLPTLYLHGLAGGDFDLALRGLLGDGAPLWAASIARLKAGWQAEYDLWKTRALVDLEPVYLWVDGIYVKAGLEKDKAAMLVVLALRDGRKVIVAVESGHRESTESWAALLRDLRRRGLRAPRLVIGDGHLGIWGALAAVYPTAAEQRCWNHRILNVLDKLPQRLQAEAKSLLTQIPYAETREAAERQKRAFQSWCTKKGVATVGQGLDRTGTGWSPSINSPRRTGSICGPRIRSSPPSPRSGCGSPPRSGTRRSRTPRRSSGRRC